MLKFPSLVSTWAQFKVNEIKNPYCLDVFFKDNIQIHNDMDLDVYVMYSFISISKFDKGTKCVHIYILLW